MPIVVLTDLKILKSKAKQEAEPVQVIPEPVVTPVSRPAAGEPLGHPPEVRFLIDAETGKCSAVAIDQQTGRTMPLSIRVSKAVGEMLRASAAKAIPPPAELHYVYDKAAQSIQVIFEDPKTGKVLHKLPTDKALALKAAMREAAGIIDASA